MSGDWLAMGAVAALAAAGAVRRGSRGSAQRQAGAQQKVVTRAGWPWSEQTPLYHGTYAMTAIERQGFRTRNEGAVSMAGGAHVRSVSTTLLPQRAAAIALALDTLARVAQRDLSLVDLVYQLQGELGIGRNTGLPLMVDALTAFSDWVRDLAGENKPYTIEAYHAILVNLELVEKGWTYVSPDRKPPKVGKPYVLPRGAILIEGQENAYLVPPGSRLPLTYDTLIKKARRQIANQLDWNSWAWDRSQGYAHGRCDAGFRIYKAALDVGDRYNLFNPVLLDTDVAALAKVSRSSIGVLEIRSTVPRICTDTLGAVRLGYIKGNQGLSEKMRSWHHDCQHALDFPRDDDFTERATTGQLFGLGDSHLRDPARWQGWSVRQQGARVPQSTMLYVDGEEEVRIYDTSQIKIVGALNMAQIRKRFRLGDRLTFPWLDARDQDVRVWR